MILYIPENFIFQMVTPSLILYLSYCYINLPDYYIAVLLQYSHILNRRSDFYLAHYTNNASFCFLISIKY